MKFKKSLFIFRRDLRIQDNTALLAASRRSEKVATAFIFNPEQLRSPYASDASILFMLSSIQSLSKSVSKAGGKLHTFAGDPIRIISKLSNEFDAIFFNRDYTPYSRERDAGIFNLCDKKGITLLRSEDSLLHGPDEISRSDGKPYSIFSAFMRKSKSIPVRRLNLSPITNLFNPRLPTPDSTSPYIPAPNHLLFKKGGGRKPSKS